MSMQISNKYLALLVQTGRTQGDIAAYLGTTQPNVCNWFRHKYPIPSKHWPEIERWVERLANGQN
jgi:hypothetical protein